MSDTTHGMALVRRAAADYRRVLVPLLVVLAINVVVYAAAVYPLSQRVANVEQRERAAEQTLADARRAHAEATGALSGQARASAELTTFYNDVLPQGLTGARRLTYLRLSQLARQSGLSLESWRASPAESRDSTLTQLNIEMELSGSWPDIRAFVYELEIAPEFVVIDNVALAEGAEGGDLGVSLALSTYYRGPARDAAP